MSFQKELKVAIDAVRKASALAYHVSAGQNISGLQKEDKSPVTVADFGAQAVIISEVHKHFPDDKIVGEEASDELKTSPNLAAEVMKLVKQFAPDDERFKGEDDQVIANICESIDLGSFEGSAKGREWALDPVDGTKGFLRGGQYAVCLGLIVDAQVKVGVIGCPNLGPDGGLFYAVKNEGGFWTPIRNNNNAVPKKLAFRKINSPSDAQFCESVESGHSALGRQSQIAKLLGITKPAVRMDSQAKYCELAAGKADVYLRLPIKLSYEEKIWDHAAGSLLITEAGGVITDMYGAPLDFGQGRTLRMNKGVIASNAGLHSRILTILAEYENVYA